MMRSAADATQRTIADAEARLAKFPSDQAAKKTLAAALLQRVRETADPSYYTAADNILATLGGARSADPEVLLLEGTLLLARHNFTQALAVGKRALVKLPSNPAVHGILATKRPGSARPLAIAGLAASVGIVIFATALVP